MPRLVLLRHAKAAPGGGNDLDRPLAERGREAARQVGRRLKDFDLRPDLILVSPARRTRETWDLVAEAVGAAAVRVDERLYGVAADGLLDLLRGTERDVGTLLIVAHNPALEDLARLLVGAADPTSQAQLMHSFPTGAFALIDVPVEDWREVEPKSGRLERFVAPGPQGG